MNQPVSVTGIDLSKWYTDGEETITAVDEVSFEARGGEITAVTGPSGSGKTTLLNLIGGIEPADAGEIISVGEELGLMNAAEKTEFRAAHVSFVFAEMNLIPVVNVYENVSLGVALLGLPETEAHGRILEALKQVGLEEKAYRLPAKLSSGERQRVAIARALARRSELIVADEPTAHLDHATASDIVGLLRNLADTGGSCVILATHDPLVAESADSVLILEDGRRVR